MSDLKGTQQARDDLIAVLRDLSDERYQQKVWIEGEPNPYTGRPDSFEFAREILFDCHDFRDPASCIGWILYNETERQLLVRVLDAIKALGLWGDDPDAKYLAHPEWPKVMQAAREAYQALKQEDEKRGVKGR